MYITSNYNANLCVQYLRIWPLHTVVMCKDLAITLSRTAYSITIHNSNCLMSHGLVSHMCFECV